MTVIECLKRNGLQIEVDSLKRVQSVDIDFINPDGFEDETQFDVRHIGSNGGNRVLAELFADFCKENGFSPNTVQSVTVVKSADSFEELQGLEEAYER